MTEEEKKPRLEDFISETSSEAFVRQRRFYAGSDNPFFQPITLKRGLLKERIAWFKVRGLALVIGSNLRLTIQEGQESADDEIFWVWPYRQRLGKEKTNGHH